jgi:hypothetical protein
MLTILLKKIRLSWFFFGFFTVYLFAEEAIIHGATFDAGALTLFSVNSFLYGFYISPVLSAQKTRIEELAKIIRAESNAIFEMLLRTKKLHASVRNKIQDMFEDYIHACLRQRKIAEGEPEYEKLISYCLNYDGEDRETMDKILNNLIANQTNRSNLAMQLGNRVFSNEWWIMLVLFSITLGFVLFLNVGNDFVMHAIKALLCTGLSMLMINLLKLSTLTHKKAKNIWDPMEKLLRTRFYRID